MNFLNLSLCASTKKDDGYPSDTRIIFAIGTDERIHILQHGDHPAIESCDVECNEGWTMETEPGIYLGHLTWDSAIDYESGFDEGCWVIGDEMSLIVKYPTLNDIDEKII